MAENWTTTSDTKCTDSTHATADDALKAGRDQAKAGRRTVTVTAPDGSSYSRR